MRHFNSDKTIVGKYAVIFFICLFFFNETTRGLMPGKSGYVNVLYLVVGSIFLIKHLVKKQINFIVFFIVSLFSAIVLMNGKISLNYSTVNIVLTITSLILPLLFICIRVNREEAIAILGRFLKWFNILITILLVVGMTDYVTNSSIQMFLASTIFQGKWMDDLIRLENSTGIYRYYSFIGHPLTNARYFLVFFILNNIYVRNSNQYLLNRYFIIIVTLLGLVLSGSKTAMLLGVLLIIFCSNITKYKWFFYTIVIIFLFVFYNTPLFQENLMQRYADGVSKGDLSTGRNEMIELLIDKGGELPNIFLGGGYGYSRMVAKSLNGGILNFEYPSIMLAYDYGYFNTIIIYICILIYPIIIFLKYRDILSLFSFIALTVMVNGNNGLANLDGDSMAQLCFIVLIMKSISQRKIQNYPNKEGIVNQHFAKKDVVPK